VETEKTKTPSVATSLLTGVFWILHFVAAFGCAVWAYDPTHMSIALARLIEFVTILHVMVSFVGIIGVTLAVAVLALVTSGFLDDTYKKNDTSLTALSSACKEFGEKHYRFDRIAIRAFSLVCDVILIVSLVVLGQFSLGITLTLILVLFYIEVAILRAQILAIGKRFHIGDHEVIDGKVVDSKLLD
jgi:hypothetical protein